MYLFSYGLYMLGGDTLFYVFGYFIVSCFTCATLIINLYYEIIHNICLLLFFFFGEIKNLFCFTCIFHTCIYVFIKCYRNIQVDSIVLLSTIATDR